MMICNEGKVSLYSFFTTVILFCVLFLPNWFVSFLNNFYAAWFWAPLFYYVLVNFFIRFVYREKDYQIALRAVFLGFVFGVGLYVKVVGRGGVTIFGIYMCVMAVFHYTEFLAIAIIQPKLVSINSFVINHSPEYTLAAVTSWIEFGLELYFFPGLKNYFWVSFFGLLVCATGELLRKGAMLTAKSNFNHVVQCEKSEGHILVTHGVYSLFRHPSYVGWFYWSIGTQIILLNPFCVVAYAIASWCYFKDRVTIEEVTLLNFFGQQYCDYQEKVGTGLPFINGYRISP